MRAACPSCRLSVAGFMGFVFVVVVLFKGTSWAQNSAARPSIELSPEQLLQIAHRESLIRQTFDDSRYNLESFGSNSASFSKDGRRMAVAARDRAGALHLLLINSQSGLLEEDLDVSRFVSSTNGESSAGSRSTTRYEHLFPDSKTGVVLLTTAPERYWYWDFSNPRPIALTAQFADALPSDVSQSTFRKSLVSPDGSKLAIYTWAKEYSGSRGVNMLRVFDARTGKLLSSENFAMHPDLKESAVGYFAWSPDGRKLLASNGAQSVLLEIPNQPGSGKLRKLPGSLAGFYSFDSDSNHLIRYIPAQAGSAFGLSITRSDLTGKQMKTTFVPNIDPGWDLGSDGKKVVFLGLNTNRLKVIDLHRKQVVADFKGGDAPPYNAVVSPNLRGVATWRSSQSIIRIGPVATEAELAAAARQNAAALFAKTPLSEVEIRACSELLPYVFDAGSPYFGLSKPKNPKLRELHEQLLLAKSGPKQLNPGVLDNPYLTLPALRILFGKTRSRTDVSPRQAAKAMKLLSEQKDLNSSDMKAFAWLVERAGLAPSQTIELFSSSPYTARKEVQSRYGSTASTPAPSLATPNLPVRTESKSLTLEAAKNTFFGPNLSPCISGNVTPAYSPDGRFVACVALGGKQLILADIGTGATHYVDVPPEKFSSGILSFSEDSIHLFYHSLRSKTIAWTNVSSPKMQYLDQGFPVLFAASPDGKKGFVGDLNSQIHQFESGRRIPIPEISGGMGTGMYEAAFSPNGKILVLWSSAEILTIDADTGVLLKRMKALRPSGVKLKVSTDNERLFVTSSQGLEAIDLVSGTFIYRKQVGIPDGTIWFFHGELAYAYVVRQGKLQVLGLDTGKILSEKKIDLPNSAWPLEVSADLRVLYKVNNQTFVAQTQRDPKEYAKLKKAAEALLLKAPRLELEDRRLFFEFARLSKDLPADPDLREWLKQARIADREPSKLTASSLDFVDAPASYFRAILEGARRPEAIHARSFHPTPQQILHVLKTMVEDPKTDAKSQELMSWLLSQADVPIDEKTIGTFVFSEKELRQDVEIMLATDPAKYKSFLSLGAIKLIKALLEYHIEDFRCKEVNQDGLGGGSENTMIGKILTAFSTYGSRVDADRVLFAKLARLLLEHRTLCPLERNLLLNAMRDWRATNAAVHYQMACAALNSVEAKPLDERSFSEAVMLSQAIGMRADISQAAWIEQLRALGHTHRPANHAQGALLDEEADLYSGLLRFVIGNPNGVLKAGNKPLKLPASAPHPGSIVKICRITQALKSKPDLDTADAALLKGSRRFIETTRAAIDEKPPWPNAFTPEAARLKSTLRQEFADQSMNADLIALNTDCATLPKVDDAESNPRVKSAPRAKPFRRQRKSRDFSPSGRH